MKVDLVEASRNRSVRVNLCTSPCTSQVEGIAFDHCLDPQYMLCITCESLCVQASRIKLGRACGRTSSSSPVSSVFGGPIPRVALD